MESIMQYPDKGYTVELWHTEQGYKVEIKHPCGEPVETMLHLPSKRNAVYWAVCKVEELGQAHHHCENDNCDNNRYIVRIAGLRK